MLLPHRKFWLHSDGTYWRVAPISGGIDVPNAGQAAQKFVRVTAGRSQDYQQGIAGTNPAAFESAATAAADVWAQGVAQAAGENRFATGLQGSGARWRRKAEQVGVSRFGPGVQAAQEDYQQGVAPYLQTMQGLTLEPRGPRGDPRNIGRVSAIAQALNEQRRRGAR